MSEFTSPAPQLANLDAELSNLESLLAPLIKPGLDENRLESLSALDRAKVHLDAAYAIESLLFCYLKLNGVNAKEHSVFKELTRMKGYFEKLAAAEKPAEERTMVVDKQAAARFIRRGIAPDGK